MLKNPKRLKMRSKNKIVDIRQKTGIIVVYVISMKCGLIS